MTGKVKEQWGKLTDDDLTVVNGKQDQLVGRVQDVTGSPETKRSVRSRSGPTACRLRADG
jgi:uncharacterized protein YjbJ (UPF0337 family)